MVPQHMEGFAGPVFQQAADLQDQGNQKCGSGRPQNPLEKNALLKWHPGRTLCRRSTWKSAKSPSRKPQAWFRPGPAGVRGPAFPGERGVPGHRGMMTVAPCEARVARGIVKPSILSPRGLAMANAQCWTGDRAAGAGACGSSCAADIMANAINPFYAVQRRQLPPLQGKLSMRTESTYARPPRNRASWLQTPLSGKRRRPTLRRSPKIRPETTSPQDDCKVRRLDR